MEIRYDAAASPPLAPLLGPPSPAESVSSPSTERKPLHNIHSQIYSGYPDVSPSIASVVSGHSAQRRTVSATEGRPLTPETDARAFSPRRNHRRGLSVIAAPIDHSEILSPQHTSAGRGRANSVIRMSPTNGLEYSPPLDHRFTPPAMSSSGFSTGFASENVASAGAAAAELYSNSNLQDILVSLAHRERQVLECKHALEDAQHELDHFRKQVDAVLGPHPIPLQLPYRPRILIRHHIPNIGIHALTYTPVRLKHRTARHGTKSTRLAGSQSALSHPTRDSNSHSSPSSHWSIDTDDYDDIIDNIDKGFLHEFEDLSWISFSSSDESDDDEPIPRRTWSLKVVQGLLAIVHCVISTLPTYQRAGLRLNLAYGAQQRELIQWRPDYPSPTETFYGFLTYRK